MRADILSEYDQHQAVLRELGQGMQVYLHGLIAARGIKTHALGHRIKDRESLRRKLARPDKTYGRLWDVTDLVGLRVTTYFEDEVDAVAGLIEGHCDVDWAHSSDKRRVLGEHSFGYRSVHYVCAFAPSLCTGQVPAELRCEIQLRTVLQHAWAEIEHDLGYKSIAGLPAQQRRRFTQLAALLELADDTFLGIRQGLRSYEEDVRERLRRGQALPLDPVSLRSLLDEPAVLALDQAVAAHLGKPLSQQPYFPDYLLGALHRCDLTTVQGVQQHVEEGAGRVVPLLRPYFDFARGELGLNLDSVGQIERGYGLYFLALLSVIESEAPRLNKVERFARLFETLDQVERRLAHQLAGRLCDALTRGG